MPAFVYSSPCSFFISHWQLFGKLQIVSVLNPSWWEISANNSADDSRWDSSEVSSGWNMTLNEGTSNCDFHMMISGHQRTLIINYNIQTFIIRETRHKSFEKILRTIYVMRFPSETQRAEESSFVRVIQYDFGTVFRGNWWSVKCVLNKMAPAARFLKV